MSTQTEISAANNSPAAPPRPVTREGIRELVTDVMCFVETYGLKHEISRKAEATLNAAIYSLLGERPRKTTTITEEHIRSLLAATSCLHSEGETRFADTDGCPESDCRLLREIESYLRSQLGDSATPPAPNEAQLTIIAEQAIEIVQDCRRALGLAKGELLTERVKQLAALRAAVQDAADNEWVAEGDEDYARITHPFWQKVSECLDLLWKESAEATP